MQILKNQDLKLSNILATRFEDDYEKAESYTKKLLAYAEAQGANVMGMPISTTFEADSDNERVIGMELFVPIDKAVPSDEGNGIAFLEELEFGSCLKLSHSGSLETINETYEQLSQYIVDNQLVQVSNPFHFVVQDPTSDTMSIDVYVSAITQAEFDMKDAVDANGMLELTDEALLTVDGGRPRRPISQYRGLPRGAISRREGLIMVNTLGGAAGGAIGGARAGAKWGPKGSAAMGVWGAIVGAQQGFNNGHTTANNLGWR